jgi:hypothetical protein
MREPAADHQRAADRRHQREVAACSVHANRVERAARTATRRGESRWRPRPMRRVAWRDVQGCEAPSQCGGHATDWIGGAGADTIRSPAAGNRPSRPCAGPKRQMRRPMAPLTPAAARILCIPTPPNLSCWSQHVASSIYGKALSRKRP